MPKSEATIYFAGEEARKYAVDIPRQLVTIRSKKKDYKSGDEVRATFQVGDEDLLHIASQRERQIRDVHPGIILLDGFLSHAEVPDMMRENYHDQEWDVTSPVTYTIFAADWLYQDMGLEEKRAFSYPDDHYLNGEASDIALIKDPMFDWLFFSAYFSWLVDFHGFSPEEYPVELHARDLISDEKVGQMRELARMVELEDEPLQQDWLAYQFTVARIPDSLR